MPSRSTARITGLLLVSLTLLTLLGVHSTLPAHAASSPFVSINPSNQPLAPKGSTVMYDVNVSNIDPNNPIYGWAIYVETDNTTLSPTGVTNGQFLPNVQLSILCINGNAQPGSQGCGSFDGPGIVHYEVYNFQTGSGTNINGTLFTISYTVKVDPTCTSCYSLVTFKQVHIQDVGDTPILNDVTGAAILGLGRYDGSYGKVPPLPIARFSWAPLTPFEGSRANFTAVASTTPVGTIIDYEWQFYSPTGGFSFASGVNISRVFGPVDAGNWTVELQVKNDQGVKSRVTSHTVTILARNILDLGITSFSATEFDGIVPGDIITFTFNVQNLGTIVPKTGFNVSLSVAKAFYHVRFNGTLDATSQHPFKYSWNTAGVQPDSYTVHARVDPLPGENYTDNNDAYISVRVVYPQNSGALLSLNLAQVSGIALLALVIVGFIFFLLGRAKRRRLLAQQEIL